MTFLYINDTLAINTKLTRRVRVWIKKIVCRKSQELDN